jgi:hypothetical protein
METSRLKKLLFDGDLAFASGTTPGGTSPPPASSMRLAS